MTLWLDPQPVDVPRALHDSVGGHPLVAETLARRGILTPDHARAFLDPSAYLPAPPTDLPDLTAAAARLRRSIERGERIVIWGDFDADGQTATALLLETLHTLGADATFHVPKRQEGHGLHQKGLDHLIASGARLILTCDTGVSAHAAVAHANERGVEVIVTDHHVPGQDLPSALAVVNPHRLQDSHPLSTLTGVGVAYELARALDPSLADGALDLVALGLVADVATLTGDTRYLVQRGLQALRGTRRPGLQAMYEAADVRPGGLSEEHVGFVLGPRLNALGRLADAAHGVELLTTADRLRARTLAVEVEGLNARRQWLTRQITAAALAQIQREPSLVGDYHALVLSSATWPSGIIGIVAGRIAERLGKPAVLIAAPEGELARGSGRSVPGIDLVAALGDCAPLLDAFGGHPGAAGFSIQAQRIPELRLALSRAVRARMETIPEPTLPIDAYVTLPELTLDLVADISRLAPFGLGNPPLALAIRDLRVLSEATIGRTSEHRRVTVEDDLNRTLTVFWWHGADWPMPQGRLDLALTIRASDYRGMTELQAEWLDARELEPESVVVTARPVIEVRDHRALANPLPALRKAMAAGDLQVWAEGDSPEGVETLTRLQLAPGPRLAVWTLPPGQRELHAVLALVRPEEVHLFSHDPTLDDASAFLERLAGMVNFALHTRAGIVDLERAAAAMGHRVTTVQAGLDWLAAQGKVLIVERDDDHWRLERGAIQVEPAVAAAVEAQLRALLEETAAYRAYALNAPAGALVRGYG